MYVFKFYKVGGYVRDELLGIPSKDIDYVVVAGATEIVANADTAEVTDKAEMSISALFVYEQLVDYLTKMGYEIFLQTPEMFTIRAKFPADHEESGTATIADFVLARKEIEYDSTSRKPKVILGTLLDDLSRRDFTVNGIAKLDDTYIDPFGGIKDLINKELRTPLDPLETFLDDPLRILRGMRFSITKGLYISDTIKQAMFDFRVTSKFIEVVSVERVREELLKMFKFSTPKTLRLLQELVHTHNNHLYEFLFDECLWLKPTLERR